MKRVAAFVAGLCLCLLACGGEGGHGVRGDTEQSNGSCPSAPAHLTGTAMNLAPCATLSDCAPVCCTCKNGDNYQYLVAECVNGLCSSTDATCVGKDDADLCPSSSQ